MIKMTIFIYSQRQNEKFVEVRSKDNNVAKLENYFILMIVKKKIKI